LKYWRWEYTGGAHGDGENYYINYNRNTGEIITWDTLFKDNKVFLNYVKRRIYDELVEIAYVGKGSAKEAGSIVTKTGYFSIRSDGLYIEFGPYEIAPYSSGLPSLSISKKVLKKYMSKTLYRTYFINDGSVYLDTTCSKK